MSKKTFLTNLLLAVVASVLTPAQPTSAQSTATAQSLPAQVSLSNAQLSPREGYQVIRAFVRTGTLNPNCLVTLGETTFVADGTLVFCAPRQPANMGKGVMISVFYPTPPPDGLILTLTLVQQSATRYGQPVLCIVDGC